MAGHMLGDTGLGNGVVYSCLCGANGRLGEEEREELPERVWGQVQEEEVYFDAGHLLKSDLW